MAHGAARDRDAAGKALAAASSHGRSGLNGRSGRLRGDLQLVRQPHLRFGQVAPADGEDGKRQGDAPAGPGETGIDRGPMDVQAAPLQRLEPGAQPRQRTRARDDLKLLPRLGAGAKGLQEAGERLLLGDARRRRVIDHAGILGRLDRRPQLHAGLGELQFDYLVARPAHCSRGSVIQAISAIRAPCSRARIDVPPTVGAFNPPGSVGTSLHRDGSGSATRHRRAGRDLLGLRLGIERTRPRGARGSSIAQAVRPRSGCFYLEIFIDRPGYRSGQPGDVGIVRESLFVSRIG